MIDEIYDREYQAARSALHRQLATLVGDALSRVGASFDALNRAQFAAPWRTRSPSGRRPANWKRVA